MPKIMPNMPQRLEDSQFKLVLASTHITDELKVRSGALISDLVSGGISEPFESFIFPEMANGVFNLDLSDAPPELTEIEFLIDAHFTSFRSWSMGGHNSKEFWENDGVEIASGSSCLMLSLVRSDDGHWNVVARNKFEGEESFGQENSSLPDDIRALAAIASARGLGKSAVNFSILFDTTASMQQHLQSEGVLELIKVMRAISASKNNRDVSVSFGGSRIGSIGVLDSADKKYLDMLAHSRSDEERQQTPPFSETVERAVKASEHHSALYVISDSIPWIDVEEIATELEAKDLHIFIVLISDNLGIDVSSLPARIVLITVPETLFSCSEKSSPAYVSTNSDLKDLVKRFV
jgi:uncharacterized tellurite resistance protein B-like protein